MPKGGVMTRKNNKEDMTIGEQIAAVREKICDEYCKWPFITETQADLNEICAQCPLNKLEEKDGWSDDNN